MPKKATQADRIRERTDQVVIDLVEAGDAGPTRFAMRPDGQLTGGDSGEWPNISPKNFATKGFVDLQVNGFAGIDFNRGEVSREDVDLALANMARTGVGLVLPTLITNSPENLIELLGALDVAVSNSRLGPLMVAGYHIEGPFLSPEPGFCGAHDGSLMTVANIDLIDRLGTVASRPIRLVTVAPERDGVIPFIRALKERGTAVSIGHSAANPEQIAKAIEAGAAYSTHLSNGLPQHLHKTENPIFWQLAEDRLTAMFIADGIHVPQSALKVMLRAKDVHRSILTTDAVSAAGPDTLPGAYTLGKSAIELAEDRSVRVPGSVNLAGSSVTMDQMFRNMIEWFGTPIPDLITMMRNNPLRLFEGQPDPLPAGKDKSVIEWTMSDKGPVVAKAHIGRFTIE